MVSRIETRSGTANVAALSSWAGSADAPQGVRKAVILAAGLGSRFGSATRGPKTLHPIAGIPILHRDLSALADVGVRDVVVVVGHMRHAITSSVGHRFKGMAIEYVYSERYASTNNSFSLWRARHHLDQDLYLVEGDVVFDDTLLRKLLVPAGQNVLAVAPATKGMNGTVVEVGAEARVRRMILGREQGHDFDMTRFYKTVNVSVLRAEFLRSVFVPALETLIAAGREHEYYESVLKALVEHSNSELIAVDCSDTRWYEIDDLTDAALADYSFSDPTARLRITSNQHGSLWRFGVTDHALLSNPYFPPPSLRHQLVQRFDDMLTHYPAGQSTVGALLAAFVGQPPERLAVGNGASELIRVMNDLLDGPRLVPVPGFNEYESYIPATDLVRLPVPEPRFEVDVDALLSKARAVRARTVIITSPNNPTGSVVSREQLKWLASALERWLSLLLVDESFVDFCARPGEQTLIRDLDEHENLVIVKSLGKVCGVGGLRIGYVATARRALANQVRQRLPIWNVNAFSEGFLRLLPHYRDDLARSCDLVRNDCAELRRELQLIPGVTTYEPNANFVFLRLPDQCFSPRIVERLLFEYNILVKSCENKSMPRGERYLRIASRTPDENMRLVQALTAIINDERAALKRVDVAPVIGTSGLLA